MAAFGLKFCDVLILRKSNESGGKNKEREYTLDYITSSNKPNKYIDRILVFFEGKKVKEMLIESGYDKKGLTNYCKEKGINIKVCDIPTKEKNIAYPHDVVMTLKDDKVIINTDELGFKEVPF